VEELSLGIIQRWYLEWYREAVQKRVVMALQDVV